LLAGKMRMRRFCPHLLPHLSQFQQMSAAHNGSFRLSTVTFIARVHQECSHLRFSACIAQLRATIVQLSCKHIVYRISAEIQPRFC
jgi:hypothetical protein